MKKVICIVGPTAIGKTDLAVELSQRFPVHVISVDSALIYKGLDIGTGKPSANVLAACPHALIDLCEVWESFSVADFLLLVQDEINKAYAMGRMPLLVGGTLMYIHALLAGLSNVPASTIEMREHFNQRNRNEGIAVLYDELQKADPTLAAHLKPTDTQRILRGLEVYVQTGLPLSSFQGKRQPMLADVLMLSLLPQEKAWLHTRIEMRFEQMLKDGLLEEVHLLLRDERVTRDMMALRLIGYRQVLEYLCKENDYDTMCRKVVVATKQLAKRQLTWLRKWPNAVQLLVPDAALLEKATQHITEFAAT